MEELTTAIQSLGRRELLALRREINARLDALIHTEPDIDAEGVALVAMQITGADIASKSKDADVVRARMLTAYRLHRAGMRYADIAPAVHRKRSDVYYLVDQMAFALEHPFTYPELNREWKTMIKLYPL